jgi:transcriptional regulator GlxA family with amidase domain
MRIAILAMDGLFDTGLSIAMETLGLANMFSGKAPPFEVSVVSVRPKVRSGLGFAIPTDAISPKSRPDWVIVPAPVIGPPEKVIAALTRPDMKLAAAQLRKWRDKGARIAASCVGTFLLAEAGVLDQREATTTWWLAPHFRQRFPDVRLDETRMLVPTDVGVTAGAAMGHLDLSLWLVRQVSPALADRVSRYLLADIRPSQAAYIIPNHLAQADPLIRRFEQWARQHLKSGFSLERASGALGITPRSLQRRCEAVLGKSPLSYFQDLRVEHARGLLHGSGLSIEAIAAEIGYADGATLRSLLRQRLGRGVRELRATLR